MRPHACFATMCKETLVPSIHWGGTRTADVQGMQSRKLVDYLETIR